MKKKLKKSEKKNTEKFFFKSHRKWQTSVKKWQTSEKMTI